MSLPISKSQAVKACQWLKACWGDEIRAAVPPPFTVDHICGIACQETAYFWLPLIDRLTPAEILARCVLDASGDASGTSRSAFPRNSAAFIKKYGPEFAAALIAEANKTRALRGWSPKQWVYKGYGIFQYDLQFVIDDEPFFRLQMWPDFRKCLDRCLLELRRTYARQGTIEEAIRAYNGTGSAAVEYRNNVIFYSKISAAVK